jgi:predicted DNA-binding protein (MmcQ/YjbR family)
MGGRRFTKARSSPRPARARPGTLARIRRFCLGLPETRETASWGHPNFLAGNKTFAAYERYKGDDCLSFKATLADQSLLCARPRFFVAPYVGQHGWTCMKLDGTLNWGEVETLLLQSYRLVAAKRMLATLGTKEP